MNCDWVKSNITLYVFEEVGDSDRAEMDQHLVRCTSCSREADAEKELRRLMDLRPKLEVSATLLESCRADLSEALEEMPALKPAAVNPVSRWQEWLAAPFAGLRLQWQAGMAVALLSVGFVSGTLVTSRYSSNVGNDVTQANIAGIHSISSRPDGGLDISLDTTHRQTIHGSLADPLIRQVLVSALGDYNSGVRLDSMEQLRNPALAGDPQVRAALVLSLQDRNPSVRLKALDALKGSGADFAVRQALIKSLKSDSNSGVRIKAIELLSGQPDSPAITALQQSAASDSNSAIRLKSAETLRKWNAPVEVY
jgi:hypothetical protein